MSRKKIKIIDVSYTYSLNKRNSLVTVEFNFQFDDLTVHQSKVFETNKLAFSLKLPYSNKVIRITNFQKFDLQNQILMLNKLIDSLKNTEVTVGYFENEYFELEVIDCLCDLRREYKLIPSFCKTSNGTLKVFSYDEDCKRIYNEPFNKIIENYDEFTKHN